MRKTPKQYYMTVAVSLWLLTAACIGILAFSLRWQYGVAFIGFVSAMLAYSAWSLYKGESGK